MPGRNKFEPSAGASGEWSYLDQQILERRADLIFRLPFRGQIAQFDFALAPKMEMAASRVSVILG